MKASNHIHIKLLSLVVLVLLVIPSCVSELDVASFSFERSVVVDAVFTDEEKVQTVRLSYTTPVGLDSLAPMTGARVWVKDDLGTRINFVEQTTGVYSTRQVFQGVEGRAYKLVFVTEEGKQYESTSEVLVKSPTIEISQRFAELPSSEFNRNEQGLQFFIDTPDGAGKAQFFRYEWNDASKRVPYPAKFNALVEGLDRLQPELQTIAVSRQVKNLKRCFQLGFSNNLILGTTTGLSVNSILDQHIRFASMERLNFMDRYTIEVIQYAVSQRAFNYYRALKEFNESNGSLFDQQPGIILGNIKSLDDEEVVLGYFEVSGVTRQRKFYNPNEFNQEFAAVFLGLPAVCHPRNIKVVDNLELLQTSYTGPFVLDTPISIDYFRDGKVSFSSDRVRLGEVALHDFVITLRFDQNDPKGFRFFGKALLAPVVCTDCRSHSEIGEEPTYWID